VLLVQGAPLLVPPMHRRPPHPVPPGQSAFELQGSAAAVAQVSQKQSKVVNPGAVHLSPAVASVVVPVVAGTKRMSRLPMFPPFVGGQS
jgi:hypothetical protein